MFLSTPPSRVATLIIFTCLLFVFNVSIHATLAGGDTYKRRVIDAKLLVSIHATLAGGDAFIVCFLHIINVSIHATLAGGDDCFPQSPRLHYRFLSTPPSRVATVVVPLSEHEKNRFYPRHPRGWRRKHNKKAYRKQGFYPRHPRGWRRIWSFFFMVSSLRFYPRHPRGWRPTDTITGAATALYVSIHATLAGGD